MGETIELYLRALLLLLLLLEQWYLNHKNCSGHRTRFVYLSVRPGARRRLKKKL
jgi:hypothetical protein